MKSFYDVFLRKIVLPQKYFMCIFAWNISSVLIHTFTIIIPSVSISESYSSLEDLKSKSDHYIDFIHSTEFSVTGTISDSLVFSTFVTSDFYEASDLGLYSSFPSIQQTNQGKSSFPSIQQTKKPKSFQRSTSFMVTEEFAKPYSEVTVFNTLVSDTSYVLFTNDLLEKTTLPDIPKSVNTFALTSDVKINVFTLSYEPSNTGLSMTNSEHKSKEPINTGGSKTESEYMSTELLNTSVSIEPINAGMSMAASEYSSTEPKSTGFSMTESKYPSSEPINTGLSKIKSEQMSTELLNTGVSTKAINTGTSKIESEHMSPTSINRGALMKESSDLSTEPININVSMTESEHKSTKPRNKGTEITNAEYMSTELMKTGVSMMESKQMSTETIKTSMSVTESKRLITLNNTTGYETENVLSLSKERIITDVPMTKPRYMSTEPVNAGNSVTKSDYLSAKLRKTERSMSKSELVSTTPIITGISPTKSEHISTKPIITGISVTKSERLSTADQTTFSETENVYTLSNVPLIMYASMRESQYLSLKPVNILLTESEYLVTPDKTTDHVTESMLLPSKEQIMTDISMSKLQHVYTETINTGNSRTESVHHLSLNTGRLVMESEYLSTEPIKTSASIQESESMSAEQVNIGVSMTKLEHLFPLTKILKSYVTANILTMAAKPIYTHISKPELEHLSVDLKNLGTSTKESNHLSTKLINTAVSMTELEHNSADDKSKTHVIENILSLSTEPLDVFSRSQFTDGTVRSRFITSPLSYVKTLMSSQTIVTNAIVIVASSLIYDTSSKSNPLMGYFVPTLLLSVPTATMTMPLNHSGTTSTFKSKAYNYTINPFFSLSSSFDDVKESEQNILIMESFSNKPLTSMSLSTIVNDETWTLTFSTNKGTVEDAESVTQERNIFLSSQVTMSESVISSEAYNIQFTYFSDHDASTTAEINNDGMITLMTMADQAKIRSRQNLATHNTIPLHDTLLVSDTITPPLSVYHNTVITSPLTVDFTKMLTSDSTNTNYNLSMTKSRIEKPSISILTLNKTYRFSLNETSENMFLSSFRNTTTISLKHFDTSLHTDQTFLRKTENISELVSDESIAELTRFDSTLLTETEPIMTYHSSEINSDLILSNSTIRTYNTITMSHSIDINSKLTPVQSSVPIEGTMVTLYSTEISSEPKLSHSLAVRDDKTVLIALSTSEHESIDSMDVMDDTIVMSNSTETILEVLTAKSAVSPYDTIVSSRFIHSNPKHIQSRTLPYDTSGTSTFQHNVTIGMSFSSDIHSEHSISKSTVRTDVTLMTSYSSDLNVDTIMTPHTHHIISADKQVYSSVEFDNAIVKQLSTSSRLPSTLLTVSADDNLVMSQPSGIKSELSESEYALPDNNIVTSQSYEINSELTPPTFTVRPDFVMMTSYVNEKISSYSVLRPDDTIVSSNSFEINSQLTVSKNAIRRSDTIVTSLLTDKHSKLISTHSSVRPDSSMIGTRLFEIKSQLTETQSDKTPKDTAVTYYSTGFNLGITHVQYSVIRSDKTIVVLSSTDISSELTLSQSPVLVGDTTVMSRSNETNSKHKTTKSNVGTNETIVISNSTKTLLELQSTKSVFTSNYIKMTSHLIERNSYHSVTKSTIIPVDTKWTSRLDEISSSPTSTISTHALHVNIIVSHSTDITSELATTKDETRPEGFMMKTNATYINLEFSPIQSAVLPFETIMTSNINSELKSTWTSVASDDILVMPYSTEMISELASTNSAVSAYKSRLISHSSELNSEVTLSKSVDRLDETLIFSHSTEINPTQTLTKLTVLTDIIVTSYSSEINSQLSTLKSSVLPDKPTISLHLAEISLTATKYEVLSNITTTPHLSEIKSKLTPIPLSCTFATLHSLETKSEMTLTKSDFQLSTDMNSKLTPTQSTFWTGYTILVTHSTAITISWSPVVVNDLLMTTQPSEISSEHELTNSKLETGDTSMMQNSAETNPQQSSTQYTVSSSDTILTSRLIQNNSEYTIAQLKELPDDPIKSSYSSNIHSKQLTPTLFKGAHITKMMSDSTGLNSEILPTDSEFRNDNTIMTSRSTAINLEHLSTQNPSLPVDTTSQRNEINSENVSAHSVVITHNTTVMPFSLNGNSELPSTQTSLPSNNAIVPSQTSLPSNNAIVPSQTSLPSKYAIVPSHSLEIHSDLASTKSVVLPHHITVTSQSAEIVTSTNSAVKPYDTLLKSYTTTTNSDLTPIMSSVSFDEIIVASFSSEIKSEPTTTLSAVGRDDTLLTSQLYTQVTPPLPIHPDTVMILPLTTDDTAMISTLQPHVRETFKNNGSLAFEKSTTDTLIDSTLIDSTSTQSFHGFSEIRFLTASSPLFTFSSDTSLQPYKSSNIFETISGKASTIETYSLPTVIKHFNQTVKTTAMKSVSVSPSPHHEMHSITETGTRPMSILLDSPMPMSLSISANSAKFEFAIITYDSAESTILSVSSTTEPSINVFKTFHKTYESKPSSKISKSLAIDYLNIFTTIYDTFESKSTSESLKLSAIFSSMNIFTTISDTFDSEPNVESLKLSLIDHSTHTRSMKIRTTSETLKLATNSSVKIFTPDCDIHKSVCSPESLTSEEGFFQSIYSAKTIVKSLNSAGLKTFTPSNIETFAPSQTIITNAVAIVTSSVIRESNFGSKSVIGYLLPTLLLSVPTATVSTSTTNVNVINTRYKTSDDMAIPLDSFETLTNFRSSDIGSHKYSSLSRNIHMSNTKGSSVDVPSSLNDIVETSHTRSVPLSLISDKAYMAISSSTSLDLLGSLYSLYDSKTTSHSSDFYTQSTLYSFAYSGEKNSDVKLSDKSETLKLSSFTVSTDEMSKLFYSESSLEIRTNVKYVTIDTNIIVSSLPSEFQFSTKGYGVPSQSMLTTEYTIHDVSTFTGISATINDSSTAPSVSTYDPGRRGESITFVTGTETDYTSVKHEYIVDHWSYATSGTSVSLRNIMSTTLTIDYYQSQMHSEQNLGTKNTQSPHDTIPMLDTVTPPLSTYHDAVITSPLITDFSITTTTIKSFAPKTETSINKYVLSLSQWTSTKLSISTFRMNKSSPLLIYNTSKKYFLSTFSSTTIPPFITNYNTSQQPHPKTPTNPEVNSEITPSHATVGRNNTLIPPPTDSEHIPTPSVVHPNDIIEISHSVETNSRLLPTQSLYEPYDDDTVTSHSMERNLEFTLTHSPFQPHDTTVNLHSTKLHSEYQPTISSVQPDKTKVTSNTMEMNLEYTPTQNEVLPKITMPTSQSNEIRKEKVSTLSVDGPVETIVRSRPTNINTEFSSAQPVEVLYDTIVTSTETESKLTTAKSTPVPADTTFTFQSTKTSSDLSPEKASLSFDESLVTSHSTKINSKLTSTLPAVGPDDTVVTSQLSRQVPPPLSIHPDAVITSPPINNGENTISTMKSQDEGTFNSNMRLSLENSVTDEFYASTLIVNNRSPFLSHDSSEMQLSSSSYSSFTISSNTLQQSYKISAIEMPKSTNNTEPVKTTSVDDTHNFSTWLFDPTGKTPVHPVDKMSSLSKDDLTKLYLETTLLTSSSTPSAVTTTSTYIFSSVTPYLSAHSNTMAFLSFSVEDTSLTNYGTFVDYDSLSFEVSSAEKPSVSTFIGKRTSLFSLNENTEMFTQSTSFTATSSVINTHNPLLQLTLGVLSTSDMLNSKITLKTIIEYQSSLGTQNYQSLSYDLSLTSILPSNSVENKTILSSTSKLLMPSDSLFVSQSESNIQPISDSTISVSSVMVQSKMVLAEIAVSSLSHFTDMYTASPSDQVGVENYSLTFPTNKTISTVYESTGKLISGYGVSPISISLPTSYIKTESRVLSESTEASTAIYMSKSFQDTFESELSLESLRSPIKDSSMNIFTSIYETESLKSLDIATLTHTFTIMYEKFESEPISQSFRSLAQTKSVSLSLISDKTYKAVSSSTSLNLLGSLYNLTPSGDFYTQSKLYSFGSSGEKNSVDKLSDKSETFKLSSFTVSTDEMSKLFYSESSLEIRKNVKYVTIDTNTIVSSLPSEFQFSTKGYGVPSQSMLTTEYTIHDVFTFTGISATIKNSPTEQSVSTYNKDLTKITIPTSQSNQIRTEKASTLSPVGYVETIVRSHLTKIITEFSSAQAPEVLNNTLVTSLSTETKSKLTTAKSTPVPADTTFTFQSTKTSSDLSPEKASLSFDRSLVTSHSTKINSKLTSTLPAVGPDDTLVTSQLSTQVTPPLSIHVDTVITSPLTNNVENMISTMKSQDEGTFNSNMRLSPTPIHSVNKMSSPSKDDLTKLYSEITLLTSSSTPSAVTSTSTYIFSSVTPYLSAHSNAMAFLSFSVEDTSLTNYGTFVDYDSLSLEVSSAEKQSVSTFIGKRTSLFSFYENTEMYTQSASFTSTSSVINTPSPSLQLSLGVLSTSDMLNSKITLKTIMEYQSSLGTKNYQSLSNDLSLTSTLPSISVENKTVLLSTSKLLMLSGGLFVTQNESYIHPISDSTISVSSVIVPTKMVTAKIAVSSLSHFTDMYTASRSNHVGVENDSLTFPTDKTISTVYESTGTLISALSPTLISLPINYTKTESRVLSKSTEAPTAMYISKSFQDAFESELNIESLRSSTIYSYIDIFTTVYETESFKSLDIATLTRTLTIMYDKFESEPISQSFRSLANDPSIHSFTTYHDTLKTEHSSKPLMSSASDPLLDILNTSYDIFESEPFSKSLKSTKTASLTNISPTVPLKSEGLAHSFHTFMSTYDTYESDSTSNSLKSTVTDPSIHIFTTHDTFHSAFTSDSPKSLAANSSVNRFNTYYNTFQSEEMKYLKVSTIDSSMDPLTNIHATDELEFTSESFNLSIIKPTTNIFKNINNTIVSNPTLKNLDPTATGPTVTFSSTIDDKFESKYNVESSDTAASSHTEITFISVSYAFKSESTVQSVNAKATEPTMTTFTAIYDAIISKPTFSFLNATINGTIETSTNIYDKVESESYSESLKSTVTETSLNIFTSIANTFESYHTSEPFMLSTETSSPSYLLPSSFDFNNSVLTNTNSSTPSVQPTSTKTEHMALLELPSLTLSTRNSTRPTELTTRSWHTPMEYDSFSAFPNTLSIRESTRPSESTTYFWPTSAPSDSSSAFFDKSSIQYFTLPSELTTHSWPTPTPSDSSSAFPDTSSNRDVKRPLALTSQFWSTSLPFDSTSVFPYTLAIRDSIRSCSSELTVHSWPTPSDSSSAFSDKSSILYFTRPSELTTSFLPTRTPSDSLSAFLDTSSIRDFIRPSELTTQSLPISMPSDRTSVVPYTFSITDSTRPSELTTYSWPTGTSSDSFSAFHDTSSIRDFKRSSELATYSWPTFPSEMTNHISDKTVLFSIAASTVTEYTSSLELLSSAWHSVSFNSQSTSFPVAASISEYIRPSELHSHPLHTTTLSNGSPAMSSYSFYTTPPGSSSVMSETSASTLQVTSPTTQSITSLITTFGSTDLHRIPLNVYGHVVDVFWKRILSGKTFATDTGIGFFMCVRECLKTAKCHSVNYNEKNFYCEYNSVMVNDTELELIERTDFVFSSKIQWPLKMIGLCQNTVCEENQKCYELSKSAVCIITNCGSIPTVANSYTTNHLTQVGATVTYSCVEGTTSNVTSAEMTVTCKGDGQWTNPKFMCE